MDCLRCTRAYGHFFNTAVGTWTRFKIARRSTAMDIGFVRTESSFLCTKGTYVCGLRKKYERVSGIVAEKEAGEKKRDGTKCNEDCGKRNISHTFVSILRI